MNAPELPSLGAFEAMKPDGERFLPGQMHGEIELEHLHRDLFAAHYVAGRDVLDIASGEGYGSDLLSHSARSVMGVDIAEDAVLHARSRYVRDDLEYRVGDCAAIPVDTASIDIAVSFETLEHHAEHHAEHDAMMREVRRVLRPGGPLVISSPDKLQHTERPQFHNAFHVKELYREEFEGLLQANFPQVALYAQKVVYASAILHQCALPALTAFHTLGGDDEPATELRVPAPDPGALVQALLDEQLQDGAERQAAQQRELLDLQDAAATARSEFEARVLQLELAHARELEAHARTLADREQQRATTLLQPELSRLEAGMHAAIARHGQQRTELERLHADNVARLYASWSAERAQLSQALDRMADTQLQARAADGAAARSEREELLRRASDERDGLRRQVLDGQRAAVEARAARDTDVARLGARARQDLEQARAESARALAALRAGQAAELHAVSSRLDLLESSWTWRATAPLRALARLLRVRPDEERAGGPQTLTAASRLRLPYPLFQESNAR